MRSKEWGSKDASVSWLARHLGLWARSLERLRPLDAPAARATAWEASWPLAQDLASVGRARRSVTAQLDEWDLCDHADTTELLVSELVTNALRYARGPARLNLRVHGDLLRCEVEDTNDAGPVRRTTGPETEGGRGTELLDLLSKEWGSFRTATGKTTWFELAAPRRRQNATDTASH
ncbi:ATP-binding protein [Streptomyces sp. NPDC055709]